MTTTTTPRYEVVALKKAKSGFKAVLVDNKHPSGVSGTPIQWFATVEQAEAKCKAAKVAYKVVHEGA